MQIEAAAIVARLHGITLMAGVLLITVAGIGTTLAFAFLGRKFLEGAARQPEMVPMLTGRMFILAAFIDAIPMISVGIAMYLIFTSPFQSQLLNLLA